MKRFTKLSAIAIAASVMTIAGGAMHEIGAQPNGGGAAGGRRGKGKGQRGGAKAVAREITLIETATGKTLTPTQKDDVRDAIIERRKATKAAQDKFLATVSQATGVPAAELTAKMRAARQQGKKTNQ